MPFTSTWTVLPGNKIFAIKVDPLKLESQNQAKNIHRVPQSNFEANWSRGSWVMIGKTEITTLYVKIIFYMIKQDIQIYVGYSRPNGWTEWADIFVYIYG